MYPLMEFLANAGANVDGVGRSSDHLTGLHGDDDELVVSVGRCLAAAVEAGEVAVVVATGDHRRRFEAAMAGRGVDVAAARRHGSYVAHDAARTLSGFMMDGHVNGILFRSAVGQLLREASRSGRPVRAYSEMVALLWDAGHINAAIDVDLLWNELLGAAAPHAAAVDQSS